MRDRMDPPPHYVRDRALYVVLMYQFTELTVIACCIGNCSHSKALIYQIDISSSMCISGLFSTWRQFYFWITVCRGSGYREKPLGIVWAC